MRFTLFLCLLTYCGVVQAQTLTGTVRDSTGSVLPFSTLLLKGSSRGVTANAEGKYFFHLDPGVHTIICEHVGYAMVSKSIDIKGDDTLNFHLETQRLSLTDIVVKVGDEDPAYGIIRHAIHEREAHHKELASFRCMVYTKGQITLNNVPKRFMGQKVAIDSSMIGQNNYLYLSETISKYAEAPPDHQKVEVISSRVSGQSDAYGLTIPYIVSFYTNFIIIGNMNPRGFISPIANSALHYYKYKLIGTFFEDGRMIDKIRVTPRRAYEPCFSGFISIVHDEWRIHSSDLLLTRSSQLALIDTFHLQQLYTPGETKAWVMRSQVGYFSLKILGFSGGGSFANTYSDFELNPLLPAGYFDNTALKYDKGSNKKPSAYWDTIRPVPLTPKEQADYHKKDSVEKVQSEPHYQDSVDRVQNRITPLGLLLTGVNVQRQKSKETYVFSSVVSGIGFNTVEGWYLHENFDFHKKFTDQHSLELNPDARYGFSNRHFNASMAVTYRFSNKYLSALDINGGRTTFQFDNSQPIAPELNSLYTLLDVRNYMKIYEATFGHVGYGKTWGKSGISFTLAADYQDRSSLANTDTGTYFVKVKGSGFTPNYPEALTDAPMPGNKAFSVTGTITWHPGMRYIEYPESLLPLGSKYPLLKFSYTRGMTGILGSAADYDKWKFSVGDDLNLKILGLLKYSLGMGGFLDARQVALPDYNHFNGNQTIVANGYLEQLQFAPYYMFSNTDRFYAEGFVEHHFNGLLTNKIPLFRRLNWYLVGGVNLLYLSDGRTYTEVFAGLENIFQLIRVDLGAGFPSEGPRITGVRIGVKIGP